MPDRLWACACGCGVFEVGTSGMLPTHPGGMAFLEWDDLNQNKNWNGKKRGSDDDNPDKQIRTNFFTAGLRYMFNRKWGILAELPFWNRYFKTTGDNGNLTSFMHSAVGDMRIRGIYSGFSPDMSTGATFGLKLPTGDFTYPNFDRDTEIGTGSTDILLGGYHFGRFPAVDAWAWFANVQSSIVTLIGGGYRPGSEVNTALGTYYDRLYFGKIKIAPLAQVIGSHRWRDSGTLANSPDTGYDRLLLSPGIEFDARPIRVYADVAFPVYQYMNGNQLVASEQFKLNIGYAF